MARHHVADGRRIIGRQRQVIKLRKLRGKPTREFEETLRAFETTQQSLEHDLEAMLRRK